MLRKHLTVSVTSNISGQLAHSAFDESYRKPTSFIALSISRHVPIFFIYFIYLVHIIEFIYHQVVYFKWINKRLIAAKTSGYCNFIPIFDINFLMMTGQKSSRHIQWNSFVINCERRVGGNYYFALWCPKLLYRPHVNLFQCYRVLYIGVYNSYCCKVNEHYIYDVFPNS